MELAIAEMEDAQAAMVISSTTAPWQIIHVNEAWSNLCGYSKTEAVGKNFDMLRA